MTVSQKLFRRKFSLTMYKNKRLMLAQMSFFKDFVHDTRGDMYPVLESAGEYSEQVSGGRYEFTGGENAHEARLIGAHFPYASYEIKLDSLSGGCGISLFAPQGKFTLEFFEKDGLLACKGETKMHAQPVSRAHGADLRDDLPYLLPGSEKELDEKFVPGMRVIVSTRREYFDIYTDCASGIRYHCSFGVPEFSDMDIRRVFSATQAALHVRGGAVVSEVSMFIDCGVSQADIRPIRYENGEVMVEGGKVYLTVSIRLQAQACQGVFSWVPGTSEFELTGALFFDAGDDRWGNDVASSILYNREKKLWYIWVCSFCRGHILGHGIARGDVRFGVNVIDIELMEKMPAGSPDELFMGKNGDEDPDMVYDEKSGKWLMTVCRLLGWEKDRPYRYFLFESDEPFAGYKFVSRAESGSETGGSIISDDGGWGFVCGSSFDKRAEYHAYRLPDLSRYELMKCDYDDGGFRGWGTVMKIWCGSRQRVFWLTFDRHKGSDFNWSYGNIYCFEADE